MKKLLILTLVFVTISLYMLIFTKLGECETSYGYIEFQSGAKEQIFDFNSPDPVIYLTGEVKEKPNTHLRIDKKDLPKFHEIIILKPRPNDQCNWVGAYKIIKANGTVFFVKSGALIMGSGACSKISYLYYDEIMERVQTRTTREKSIKRIVLRAP